MIFDLHNDIMTAELPRTELRAYLDKALPVLKGMIAVYWTTKQGRFPKKIAVRKRKNLHVAIEDLGCITPGDYAALIEFAPLYCSLTWNNDNPLAGGAHGISSLTDLGREVIALLNRANIVLDTAHLNRGSFDDAIELAERVICSHTCLDCILPHPRNLTDRQIRLILEKGGIVGLTLVPDFMAKTPADANDYFMQIDTFVSKYGIDHVAIGTDFFGVDDPPLGLKGYHDFLALEYTMLNAGYKRDQIDKVYYKNAMRFFALGPYAPKPDKQEAKS